MIWKVLHFSTFWPFIYLRKISSKLTLTLSFIRQCMAETWHRKEQKWLKGDITYTYAWRAAITSVANIVLWSLLLFLIYRVTINLSTNFSSITLIQHCGNMNIQENVTRYTHADGAVFSYCRPGGVSFVLCAISACFSSWQWYRHINCSCE